MSRENVPVIDVAHPARRYNYWLGGKDNFAADRESGDRIAAAYPQVVTDARANRAWMLRVARRLAREHGVRQFIDVGVGLPTMLNLHDILQGIDPISRILYVDNDPLVMVHARALLTGTRQGATAYAEVSMHDTDRILAEARKLLNFEQPVAVLYCAVLHFENDDQQAYDVVARTVERLPAGSYLAVSHFTLDGINPWRRWKVGRLLKAGPEADQIRPRTRRQFARFFDGLELLSPGIVPISRWRPDLSEPDETQYAKAHVYGAVGVKP